MNYAPKAVSVVICTRNRGRSVTETVETVLANTYHDFEVLVIDQSTDQDTEDAIEPFRTDSRFRYIRSETEGQGRSRNIGLSSARGEIVAFTDDDCTVPPDWLEVIAAAFEKDPRIAMVYCNVDPAPHDENEGFIPYFRRRRSQLYTSTLDKCRARGIGAGMAVRKAAILAIGGFDESLGPGARFRSADDWDLTARVLINKLWVYETPDVAVVHYGFRTWKQGKDLTRHYSIGTGATYAKPLKCGHWDFAVVVALHVWSFYIWGPLSKVFYLKRPQGFKQLIYFLQGFFHGLKTPVERRHIVYKTR